MPKVRVHNFSITLDGFAAGPNQRLDAPFGDLPEAELHHWMFQTRFWHEMQGESGGDEGLDQQFASRWTDNIGATIMGRNMFGPVRGPWGDEEWKGWWGPNPPYHHSVFVLTHYARPSITMEGGTEFHFVDGGPEAALQMALTAAGGKDVLIGGGAATIRQYLRAGLIDEMEIAIAPMLNGAGERLFDDVGDLRGYECAELVSSPAVVHARIVRRTT
jgi:dihydrofolate reductase